MNKTEIEYIKDRVKEVVLCTNGKISTKMNKKKKGTGLTNFTMIQQIKNGKAELKPDIELANLETPYKQRKLEDFFIFFNFQQTDKQRDNVKFNKNIKNSIEEMHSSVELAGKRLVDVVVLGILAKKDLPGQLEKLARMFETNKCKKYDAGVYTNSIPKGS